MVYVYIRERDPESDIKSKRGRKTEEETEEKEGDINT